MQPKPWVLALALALASTAVADNRPKIYVPRHVKRQFTNGSETRDVVFPPATPAPNPARTSQPNVNGNGGSRQGSSGEGSSGQDATLETRSGENSIIALNIPNTVVVQPTEIPSVDTNSGNGGNGFGGGNADSNTRGPSTQPPSSGSQPEADDNTGRPTGPTGDSTGPIVIAPTGLVDPQDTVKPSKPFDSSAPSAEAPSQDATPTGTDPTVKSPKDKNPSTNDATTEDSSKAGSSAGSSTGSSTDPSTDSSSTNSPDSVVNSKGLTTSPEEQTPDATSSSLATSSSPTPTTAKDSKDDGIIGIIGGILGSGNNANSTKAPNTAEPAETSNPDTTADASTSSETDKPTETDSATNTATTSETDSATTTKTEDLPIPVITLPPVPTSDLPLPNPSDIITSIGNGDIPIPIPPVLNETNTVGTGPTEPNNTPTVTIPTVTLDPVDTPTVVLPPIDSTTTPPVPPTSEPTQPTGEPTSQPTVVVPTGDPPVSTQPPVTESPVQTPPPTSPGNTPTGDPTPTPPIGNTTVPSGPESTPSPPGEQTVAQPPTPVTSIPVLSTVTGTQERLGTALVADQTAAAAVIAGESVSAPAPTASAETLPAGMPKTIEATEEDNPVQPEGTTLIRIVFDRRLHYEFVADNFTAAQQIFTYLPSVISFGENIDTSKIQMMRLAPVETKNSGYFPTAAFLYVPASVIGPLSTDIHLPNSNIYHNSHPVAFQLAGAIDPKYGIIPGSETDGTTEDKGPGGAPFGTGNDQTEEQTPQQKGTTVAIAMGTVSFAVAYGAAMFIVARRYKRKKQAHRRASSVTNTSDMRYSPSGSPAMMGGALLSRSLSGYGGVGGVPGGRESHGSGRSGAGNSGRTAYISAPVAAENSLGWN